MCQKRSNISFQHRQYDSFNLLNHLISRVRRHHKFVSLDAMIMRLENLRRVFVTSLFDCCREKAIKGNANSEKGKSHIFYACLQGGVANAGSAKDNYSPTTENWLRFMMGNPGALYPLVLN